MQWSTTSLIFPLTNGAEHFVCFVHDVLYQNNDYAGKCFLHAITMLVAS